MIKQLKRFQNELVEFNGKLCQIKIELVPFHKIDTDVKIRLLEEYVADDKANLGMELMKIDEKDQIEKFGMCRYGGLDDLPDFDKDKTNHEWYNCGHRGHCPGEGLVCKSMQAKYGKISPRMIQYLSFIVKGLTDEEIANKMGLKPSTTRTLKKRCLDATGLPNKSALIAFAKDKNIA